jgi:hypothetical protein
VAKTPTLKGVTLSVTNFSEMKYDGWAGMKETELSFAASQISEA